MPRAKRTAKAVTADAISSEQPAEQHSQPQGEIATEAQENTTAERASYRVFAHDNATGMRYIEDYARGAVALSFAEKPGQETIAKLRASPFKWNAEAQAWLAPATYVNRDAGQKLFREIAGIQLEGPTPF